MSAQKAKPSCEREKLKVYFEHAYWQNMKTCLETEMEVLNIDVLVRCSLALAPQQKPLLGCHFLDGNVLDSETQDDGPNHTKSHFQVSIDNFFSAN